MFRGAVRLSSLVVTIFNAFFASIFSSLINFSSLIKRELLSVSFTLPSNLPNPPNPKSHKASHKSIGPLVIVAILALFVAVSAVPQYVGGWPWATPPKLVAATRNALQTIPQKGLEIPGWLTSEQSETKLGGKTWSAQQLSAAVAAPDGKVPTAFLLLRPQVYEADQPEVEWLDIRGSQQWTTDSYKKVTLEVPFLEKVNKSLQQPIEPSIQAKKNQTVRISSDFFRAWSKDQTYAVLQWYAWTNGGGPSPAQWFWADQKAQWNRRQRMPWVAVSVWLPIEPFSDISLQQEVARSLGESLQQALCEKIFLAESAGPPSRTPSGTPSGTPSEAPSGPSSVP
jgi:cyanoexosortase B-associated protein